MSITNAGNLLKIWTLRMRMQEDGITHPSEAGQNLAKLLVEKLSQLDSSEAIEIVTAEGDELPAKFVRMATGETVAEIKIRREAAKI